MDIRWRRRVASTPPREGLGRASVAASAELIHVAPRAFVRAGRGHRDVLTKLGRAVVPRANHKARNKTSVRVVHVA